MEVSTARVALQCLPVCLSGCLLDRVYLLVYLIIGKEYCQHVLIVQLMNMVWLL